MANTQGKAKLIFILVIGLFFIVTGFYATVVVPFKKEKRYLEMELKRASKEDKDYWKKEIRNLYISYIFFLGKD